MVRIGAVSRLSIASRDKGADEQMAFSDSLRRRKATLVFPPWCNPLVGMEKAAPDQRIGARKTGAASCDDGS